MRTTLDIDDDLLQAAKALSRQQGRSAGQVVSDLLRRALSSPPAAALAPGSVLGFRPFASRGSPVTNDHIDQLRDIEGA